MIKECIPSPFPAALKQVVEVALDFRPRNEMCKSRLQQSFSPTTRYKDPHLSCNVIKCGVGEET